ncbi:hypothetical protein SeMB42_g04514 [Synchytrium endobioticum]|uniref:Uncharacterized protein n=1 Tax=Synchytrium endobioticum TaxID=286115 RepID=A0A507CXK5_9FUNG|nr:hypothetical protein SeMB42_g04514 [Synchytrium endobioticum]
MLSQTRQPSICNSSNPTLLMQGTLPPTTQQMSRQRFCIVVVLASPITYCTCSTLKLLRMYVNYWVHNHYYSPANRRQLWNDCFDGFAMAYEFIREGGGMG